MARARDAQQWPETPNLLYIEELYTTYQKDPTAVPPEWRQYFDALEHDLARPVPAPPPRPAAQPAPQPAATAPSPAAMEVAGFQERVDELVEAYRELGHLAAQLDPLGSRRPEPAELDPAYYGFTEADLARPVPEGIVPGVQLRTLGELVAHLRETYCRTIGVEFMHIDDSAARNWLIERMEATANRTPLDAETRKRILARLTEAAVFEEFVQKKYLGAKTFSLEGSETLIPLIDLAIEHAAERGVVEIVMAMAHRGRLNVLANIFKKPARDIFLEFEEVFPEDYRGDVKYHLGYSSDHTTTTGKPVHLSLCFNPSHLEYINTVALGRTRAKQDRFGDAARTRGMALIVHGDAAFAGEGIVQETLNLSRLPAYEVGGTLHVIVNNQVGFTTSPEEGRSTLYATDVAKMLQVPIFHVNGEDPEAVAHVVALALEFRKTFHRDVVIDLYAFRRRGHNEADEPSFTQPLMYKAIARHEPLYKRYRAQLVQEGVIREEEAEAIARAYREHLEAELEAAKREPAPPKPVGLGGIWNGYVGGLEKDVPDVDTGVKKRRLVEVLQGITQVPKGFNLHPKLKRFMKQREEMAQEKRPVDWATAEALAFGTLVTEGYRVRMSGQDSRRGTFSQRHAALYDYETGEPYIPLANLAPDQAPFEIYNSPLSEAGVLGFEYGYSLDTPDGLVLWEAQFGDFVNVAQVIIDQFIASAEAKWNRLSGLVMLLPHGLEGQGPEHSSARLERFLMLAAADNIQVTYPTTPAQYFHLLRRQVLRPWRKPLVVLTPKSLLRHPEATSPLEAFTQGRFRRVIPDATANPEKVKKILLVSGKIYYELEAKRRAEGIEHVAIVRLEQLYPFPEAELEAALAPYKDGTPVVWVQEEPVNMGAWPYLRMRFCQEILGRFPLLGVSRPESASPATGSSRIHKLEQERLLTEALKAE